MDNLLEILIPLIIAAVYFFGNMFSSKGEGGEERPGGPRETRRTAPDSGDEERQRRIQEEIRRKIMERRRAASGGAPVATETGPAPEELRERREAVEQRRQLRERQRGMQERSRGTESAPPEAPASRKPIETGNEGAFSWDTGANQYQSQLDERLKQIEATKRHAAKLKEKSGALGGIGASTKRTVRSSSAPALSGSVRGSLRNPSAARIAFIYGEVLGTPIALRKSESDVPGLRT